MVETTFLVIENMREITRAEYYEMRKDKRKIVVDKPYGFVWSVGAERLVFLTEHGKFYKGDLPLRRSTEDFEDFDFVGMDFRAPQGVFKRRQLPIMSDEPIKRRA